MGMGHLAGQDERVLIALRVHDGRTYDVVSLSQAGRCHLFDEDSSRFLEKDYVGICIGVDQDL